MISTRQRSRRFPSLALEPDLPELRRYLGYRGGAAPGRRLAEDIERLVRGGFGDLSPRGVYAVLPVCEHSARSLVLDRVRVEGRIAEHLGQVERVAVFVVTAGDAISDRSSRACLEGDVLTGWVLDALGSWAAEAAAEALLAELTSELGDGAALTLRYSPGHCGMRLDQQRALFALVDAESIGVTLTPSSFMKPEKSVSGLVGIVPRLAATAPSSPCERCSQPDCRMRRPGPGSAIGGALVSSRGPQP